MPNPRSLPRSAASVHRAHRIELNGPSLRRQLDCGRFAANLNEIAQRVLTDAEEAAGPFVQHGETLSARLMAKSASQPRLADTGRADDDQMVMIAQPLAGGELVEQGAVEAAGRVQVDVLHDGGLAQLGRAQPACEALVLAAGRFAVDQQAEPILTG